MQLFAAEAPGPNTDKLHPRITDTAKRLWLIYFSYTAAETILLQVAGMTFFDAINHSLCTLSTGGFSTKNASVAYWNGQPVIQYIIIVFMFLAGTNFVLSYFAFKGKIQKAIFDEEFKLYFKFIFCFYTDRLQHLSFILVQIFLNLLLIILWCLERQRLHLDMRYFKLLQLSQLPVLLPQITRYGRLF